MRVAIEGNPNGVIIGGFDQAFNPINMVTNLGTGMFGAGVGSGKIKLKMPEGLKVPDWISNPFRKGNPSITDVDKQIKNSGKIKNFIDRFTFNSNKFSSQLKREAPGVYEQLKAITKDINNKKYVTMSMNGAGQFNNIPLEKVDQLAKEIPGLDKIVRNYTDKEQLKMIVELCDSGDVAGLRKYIEGISNTELSRLDYLRNKYGKLTSEQINNRINLRGAVNDEVERLYKSGITKKELGPAVAGVLDTKTDKYYFGINNIEGDIPKELHSLIKERIDNMPQNILDSYSNKTLGAGSHAEVYALNEALLANPNANLDNFMVYVVRSGKKLKPKGLPMPRCPHCEYITNGASYFPEVLKYGN